MKYYRKNLKTEINTARKFVSVITKKCHSIKERFEANMPIEIADIKKMRRQKI